MGHTECSRNVTRDTVLKSQCEWEDNIKMDLKEMGWEGMDWIYMAQDRNKWQAVVNIIIYLQAA
jgi:hypothetical protein